MTNWWMRAARRRLKPSVSAEWLRVTTENSVRTARVLAEDRVLSALEHEAGMDSIEPEIAVPRGWFYSVIRTCIFQTRTVLL